MRRVLLLLIAVILASTVAYADCVNPNLNWGLSGFATASASNGSGSGETNTQYITPTYGCQGGSNSASTSASGSSDNGSADSFSSVSASFGHIGASAYASGQNQAGGSSEATGEFKDYFTVNSSQYGNGTVVPFEVSLGLSVEYAGDQSGTASADLDLCQWVEGYGCGGGAWVMRQIFSQDNNGDRTDALYDSLYGTPIDTSDPLHWSDTVYLVVGQLYMLDGDMSVSANAHGDYTADGPSFDENVVATHSAAFSLTSLDSTVSYSTLSGCTFNGTACGATPASVPEPASLALFGSGIGALGAFIRRRRARR